MHNRRSQTRSPASAALQRGMSLIEIIIVIVLIGLIVTVVGRKVFGASDRNKAKLSTIAIEGLGAKVTEFKETNGRYPASLDDLVKEKYSKAEELRDVWGHPIEYRVPGENGREFDLVSRGKDGQPGGEGPDADVQFE